MKSRHTWPKTAYAAPFALAALLLAAGCGDRNKNAGAPQALEVSYLSVKPESVTLSRELPGRLSAYKVAEVRARISGIVQKRLFVEGADVKEGDVLFEIDPAPYEAALDSARAALGRAEANLAALELQVSRMAGLVETNAVSKQTYDNAVANRDASRADVAAGKASVRTAEINLGYTKVTSPITGRIGRAEVTEGAYVQQGTATLLAKVQQLDPLYVDLNQSAEEVLALKQALASGGLQKGADGKAKLTVLLGNGAAYGQAGSLEFSDVSVNTSTGTVTLRGTVPNPNDDLLPGLFVRARLESGTNPEALLVPQLAVRRNNQGNGTVMVIGADNKVEVRVIETSNTVGDRWIVTKGIQAGDRIITDNLQKIRPGMPVRPAGAPSAAANTNNAAPQAQPQKAR